jgi:hypothetical protein
MLIVSWLEARRSRRKVKAIVVFGPRDGGDDIWPRRAVHPSNLAIASARGRSPCSIAARGVRPASDSSGVSSQ